MSLVVGKKYRCILNGTITEFTGEFVGMYSNDMYHLFKRDDDVVGGGPNREWVVSATSAFYKFEPIDSPNLWEDFKTDMKSNRFFVYILVLLWFFLKVIRKR